MGDQRVYCPVCAGVIGVYERAIVLDQARPRETSLASEPSLRDGQQVLVHHGCAAAAQATR